MNNFMNSRTSLVGLSFPNISCLLMEKLKLALNRSLSLRIRSPEQYNDGFITEAEKSGS